MTKQQQWTWTLAAAVALAVWVAPVLGDPLGAAHPRNLLELSVDDGDRDAPVVRLAADGEVPFESFVLDGPDRLVLDLPGVVNRLEDSRVSVGLGGVARVRAAQHATAPLPVTRVVFDLERPLTYRIEQLRGALSVSFNVEGAALIEPADAEFVPAWRSAPEPATLAAVDEEPEPITALVRELEARGLEPQPLVEPERDPPVAEPEESSRAVESNVIDRLLRAPVLAAPQSAPTTPSQGTFETQTIVTDEVAYTGQRVSLNFVDADIKQVFRLFHEISGLNFVLDPGVSGRVTIVLDQVPWDQALDIILKNNGLDKVLENNVLRIATTQKLAEEASSRKQLRDAKELEVEPITLTRTLSYAKARDVERVIRDGGILSTRGSVIVDDRTNTLIMSDVPKKVEPIDALISTLDSETPQVMIEARIVETSRSYVQDLGVRWGAAAIADASRGTSTGLDFPHNASARYGLNLPGDGGASTLAMRFSNIVDSFTLDVALHTLETEGHGRILSSPKVATQNNERAEIEQGVRIPIVSTTATEIDVQFVSASLRLVVTPQITAEGTIILDIEVENNSPDFVNTAGDIPSIRTQRAQTKVLISDGGTTVIGGIFTVNEGTSEVGVPWFRKIPVFGWLFRTQNITNENRELLIFITPKIVKLT